MLISHRYTLTAVGEDPAANTLAPPHVISFERTQGGYYHVSYRPADPDTFDRDLPSKYANTIQVHYTKESPSDWRDNVQYGYQGFDYSHIVGWASPGSGEDFQSQGDLKFAVNWVGRSAAKQDMDSSTDRPLTTTIEIDFCLADIKPAPQLCTPGTAGCVEECSTLTETAAAFAEEWGAGSDYADKVYTDSSDMELFGESDGSDHRYVGLQYSNVAVPKGSAIKAASISFKVDEHPKSAELGSVSVLIQAEKGASSRLSEADKDLSNRAQSTTGPSAAWLIPSVKVSDTVGDIATTSDISVVVQSLIDGASWEYTSNRPTFLLSRLSGSGTRTFESEAYMPRLTINYCHHSQQLTTPFPAATTTADSGESCATKCTEVYQGRRRGLRPTVPSIRPPERQARQARKVEGDDSETACPGR